VTAAEVSPLNRLFTLAPLARLRAAIFGVAARLRLVRFDRLRPERTQLRTLLGLVHRARATAFGREHDFDRIRSPGDFRRLVPLRTPAELAREYPEPGQTWPVRSLAPQFVQSQRQALGTALSLALAARPRARLLDGCVVWLGDADDGVASRFPLLVRPSLRTVEGLARAPITCLVGPAGRVAGFLERMKVKGGAELPCPSLAAIVYCRQAGFPVENLQRLAGPRVLLVETVERPGATVAIQDQRHGALRLLPDHGAYFEFVPADQAGRLHPTRLGVGEVRPGVPCEVAITSPAGWWACRSGLVVSFDKTSPPLLRVVDWPVSPAAHAPGSPEPAAVTARGPHLRSGDSPAGLPETTVRSPWSVPVDRG
jgi:hypothetical protein